MPAAATRTQTPTTSRAAEALQAPGELQRALCVAPGNDREIPQAAAVGSVDDSPGAATAAGADEHARARATDAREAPAAAALARADAAGAVARCRGGDEHDPPAPGTDEEAPAAADTEAHGAIAVGDPVAALQAAHAAAQARGTDPTAGDAQAAWHARAGAAASGRLAARAPAASPV